MTGLYVFEAPIDLLAFLTLYPEDWAATQLCGALWYSGTRHALDAGTESKAAKDYSLPGS